MPRLTNDTRGLIVKALTAHKFDGQERALCEEARKLGLAMFAHVMGADFGQLDSQPCGRFHYTSALGILTPGLRSPFASGWGGENNASYVVQLDRTDNHAWPALMDKPTAIPYRIDTNIPQIPRTSPLWAEAEDLAQRARAHRDARADAAARAAAVVDTFTTSEKLVKAWPEIAPFIPGAPKAAPVPALPVADLNTMFGLAPAE